MKSRLSVRSFWKGIRFSRKINFVKP